ncbi:hypothetical protein D3P08_19920 [Paenibacillus nanensis]|uniref:M23ase beta-sheet core domain-containing protein n=1 Tax=Paenibacillus nanensis TaxID=393251 RepID=A0A3A1UPR4_9BACL|nr:M23 family metallopeptidase [Paenibacillus nanensis]RIX50547.1 hypothetical protein D3P08_19920 [Paenibacillus nanensis]
MGLRNDVKQRRQEKIKSLIHQYQESAHEHNAINRGIPSEPVKPEPRAAQTKESKPAPASLSPAPANHPLDPELAWKRNPNPWSGWEDRDREQPPGSRSFVKSQHTDDFQPPDKSWGRFRKELTWKVIVSALMFGAVWAVFEVEHPLTQKGQAFVKEAMTEEINFEAVALWYNNVFAGAPSFIPLFDGGGSAELVDGKPITPVVAPLEDAAVVRTFAELLNGIELAGASEAEVMAAETGRVIQVTERGDSVLIQHANNRITIYGKLESASVAVNDWVEAGQPIGKLPASQDGDQSFLYFAVKQNDRYMDPLDVIPLD